MAKKKQKKSQTNSSFYIFNPPSPLWCNDYALWFTSNDYFLRSGKSFNPFQVQNFDLDYFPLVADFEIRIEHCQIWFFSQSLGYLTEIKQWSICEFCHRGEADDLLIPVGSLSAPYEECDQGWELIIGEHNDFVYIMQGDFTRHNDEKWFPVWFKVAKAKYFEQWQSAIKVLNTKIQFDC
jgi:hypothetical protein